MIHCRRSSGRAVRGRAALLALAFLLVPACLAPPAGAAEVEHRANPAWFDGARVQAHTRLAIAKFHDDPVFLTAAERYRQMGVRAFTRHTKTGQEACWWPSKVGEVLDIAKDRNWVKEMIDNAHARDMRIIGYYRHMEDLPMLEKHPDWACRDWNGEPASAPRGKAYMCFHSPFLDFLKKRLLEQVDMGIDGFYFDEVHMPAGSRFGSIKKPVPVCCCKNCRKKFKATYGVEMFEFDGKDPRSLQLIDFYNRTLIEAFTDIINTVHAKNPDCVCLISTTWTPMMHEPRMSSAFAAVADSPKTEWGKPLGGLRQARRLNLHQPGWDVRWASGFTWLRSACDDRLPHSWINGCWTAEEALGAAAAKMTYGLIANLDVDEGQTPYMPFKPAFELGDKVSPWLAGTRPVRYVAIHFSEAARNRRWPDTKKIWNDVILACDGPFEALCRARLPVAYVTDAQLEAGALERYRLLVLPTPEELTPGQAKAVEAFGAAGGVVMANGPDTRFDGKANYEKNVGRFLGAAAKAAPLAPCQVVGGPERLHAVAWERPDGAHTTVMVLNDFTWIGFHGRRGKSLEKNPELVCRPGPPASDAVIQINTDREPAKVFDAVSGRTLAPRKTDTGWSAAAPEFPYLAAVVWQWK